MATYAYKNRTYRHRRENGEHKSTIRRPMTRVDPVPQTLAYSVSRVVYGTVKTSLRFHGSSQSGLDLSRGTPVAGHLPS